MKTPVTAQILYTRLIMNQSSILDGVSSWSAALVGNEFKIPLEFFLDATDENYVQLKSGTNSGKKPCCH